MHEVESNDALATIFYSWQSELSRKRHQSLIREALRLATGALGDSLGIRFEIDEATRDEAGSPEIDQVLQRKIAGAVAFVADVSRTATSVTDRPVPNANVLVEIGIALESLGREAVVLVFNEDSGEISGLPFDIRNRRLCKYRLAEASTPGERKAELSRLSNVLREALKTSIGARYFEEFPDGAPAVIEWIVRNGTSDGKFFVRLGEFARIAAAVGAPAQCTRDTLALLRARGLVDSIQGLGSEAKYEANTRLLVEFDPIFLGWNARRDAEHLGRLLYDRGNLSAPEVAAELSWESRRLNPAVYLLEQLDLCLPSKTLDADSPFRRLHLRRNANTALVLSRKTSPLGRMRRG